MTNLNPTVDFIDTMRFGAYIVVAQCTVYSAGVATNWTVPISVGNITVDRSAAQRRTAQITAEITPTVPPPALLPVTPTSPLAPFGNEIFIQLGIATASGSAEPTVQQFMPVGLFSIVETTVDDTMINLTTTLQLYDRSWIISQRQLILPYNVPAVGGNVIAEIENLINYVWYYNQGTGELIPNAPTLTFNMVPNGTTLGTATYNQGQDPWQAVQDMANSIGYEVFFDANGVVQGYPVPDGTKLPVTWNFTDNPDNIIGSPAGSGSTELLGSPYSTPVGISVQMSRDGVYNDVYVTGVGTQNASGGASGSTEPVLAEVQDTNPNSATYINGPVGDIPEFVSSNLVLSPAQAEAYATSQMLLARNAAYRITIAAAPNPMFDIDQVVTVTHARLGLNNVPMIIDEITHVINYADLMQITGRVLPTAGG